MAENTKETGLKTTCMGKGYIHGVMAGDTRAITTKTKNMDSESTNGWMEGSMRACGWMGNNMAKESIFCLTDPLKLGDGLMGRGWSGLKMNLRSILFKKLKS